jgi:hypothetical protein
MKNLFLALAFMLVSTFAFANNIGNDKSLISSDSYIYTNTIQSPNQHLVINSLEDFRIISEELSNIDNACSVSFTFEINVGVFSASGTIEGSCQEARDFFTWINSFFE